MSEENEAKQEWMKAQDESYKKRQEAIAKAGIEFKLDAAKADIEYKKSIRPVKIVELEIPFGDVMWLTFQGFCASLIIAIPIVFIFLMIINS
jgi:hypothetical protein